MPSKRPAPLRGPVDLAACRRPDKQAFPTRGAVVAWLRTQPALRRAGNTPYRCAGGHWHYGRKPKDARRRRAV